MGGEKLNVQQVLDLRRKAVAQAEQQFAGAKNSRARHYARLQLARNRRALEAQESVDAEH